MREEATKPTEEQQNKKERMGKPALEACCLVCPLLPREPTVTRERRTADNLHSQKPANSGLEGSMSFT